MTDITSRVGIEFTATGDSQVVRSLDDIAKIGAKAETALQQTANAQVRVAEGAKMAAAQSKVLQTAGLNLSRQFTDVGVSLASGISPMMVLIQQGPQIADAFAMAKTQGMGFSQVVRGLGASIAPVAPLLVGVSAALAVVAGGFALFERAVDKQTKNATTFGETWQATLNVVGKAIMSGPIGDGLKWLGETFNKVMNTIVRGTMSWLDQLVGFWGAAYLTITKNWRNLPQAIGAIMVAAANNTIATVEGLVNAVIRGINRVSSLAGLKAIADVDLPRLKQASNAVAAQFEKDQARIAASFRASREGLFDKIVAETDRLHDAHKKATKAADDHAKALQKLKAVSLETIDSSTIGQSWVLPMQRFNTEGLVPTSETIGQAFAQMRREVTAISSYMRDRFLYSGKVAFKEIGQRAKEELRAAIYDSFLAKPIKVVLDAVVQGLPTTGLGMALGLGQFAADTIGGRGGRAVSGGIGLAATGLGVGAFAGTAAGAAALGSIGLGGAVGSIAALAGPIGIAAGALYAAVKLFNVGGKPSNAGAGFDLTTGALSGNKRTAETEQAAQGAGQAIQAIQDNLKAAGIGLTDSVRGLVIGTRDQTQIYLASGKTLLSAVGDSGAAVDTALRALLAGATYVSDAQKSLVESALAAGKGFDAISEILSKYESAQAISGNLADAILQLKDPKAFDLEQVRKNIQSQRDAAKKLADDGFITADVLATINGQLDTLSGLQIDQVMKRYGDAIDDATKVANDNLTAANDAVSAAQQTLIDAYGREADALKETADRFRALASSLRQYGQSLTGGQGFGASYATARAQFLRTSALAQSGDAGALADLQRVSDAYLQAAKTVAPDARAYARDLAAVRNAVEASAQVADAQASAAELQLQALHDVVAALVKVDESVITVQQAISGLASAMAAQAQAQADLVAATKSPDTAQTVAAPANAPLSIDTTSLEKKIDDLTTQMTALQAENNALTAQVATFTGTQANVLTRVTRDGESLITTPAA